MPVPAFSPGTDAGRVCTRALHDAKPAKHTQPFTGERGQGDRDFKIVVYLINELFCNLTHSFLNKKIHKKVLQISYKGAIILKHLKSAEGISMPFGIYCQRV